MNGKKIERSESLKIHERIKENCNEDFTEKRSLLSNIITHCNCSPLHQKRTKRRRKASEYWQVGFINDINEQHRTPTADRNDCLIGRSGQSGTMLLVMKSSLEKATIKLRIKVPRKETNQQKLLLLNAKMLILNRSNASHCTTLFTIR